MIRLRPTRYEVENRKHASLKIEIQQFDAKIRRRCIRTALSTGLLRLALAPFGSSLAPSGLQCRRFPPRPLCSLRPSKFHAGRQTIFGGSATAFGDHGLGRLEDGGPILSHRTFAEFWPRHRGPPKQLCRSAFQGLLLVADLGDVLSVSGSFAGGDTCSLGLGALHGEGCPVRGLGSGDSQRTREHGRVLLAVEQQGGLDVILILFFNVSGDSETKIGKMEVQIRQRQRVRDQG